MRLAETLLLLFDKPEHTARDVAVNRQLQFIFGVLVCRYDDGR